MNETVWSTQDRTRHFIIPDIEDLSDGDFILRTVVGRQMEVDEASVLQFEVSRDEAKAFLSGQMNEVFTEAKNKLLGFLAKKQEAKKNDASSNDTSNTPPEHTLTNKLNEALGELPEEQQKAIKDNAAALTQAFQELGNMLKGVVRGDEGAMNAAKERVDKLRREVELREESTGAPFSNGARAKPKESGDRAGQLDALADWIEQLASNYANQLRDKAQSMRSTD